MRKAIAVVAIAIAVIIIVVVVFLATFDVNRYRGPIQAELQKRLGRDVSLGPMRLSLFPPAFQADSLKVSDDRDFGARAFIQAERVNVSARLLPLIHGRVEVSSLDLKRPVVELVKNEQGRWNYASLGTGAGAPPEKSLSLGDVSIEDGQVAITDRQARAARAVYNHIDLDVQNLTPGSRFSLQLAVRLPGRRDQEVRVEGDGGPLRLGDLASTPFQGTIDLDGTELAGLSRLLGKPTPSGLDGALTGKVKIDLKPETLAASGQLKIDSASVHRAALGYPISARFNLNEASGTGLLTINQAAMTLGATPLDLAGTVDTKQTPARLNLRLKAQDSSLAEVARLASAFGVGFSPDTTVNGRLNTDVRIGGTTDRPILNGMLAARNVKVTGQRLAQPLDISAVNLRLTPADVRSDPFDIVSGQTKFSCSFALHDYASDGPVVDADLSAPRADLGAVLALAKAYGARALDNVNGSGSLSLNMRLSGRVKSMSGDGILRALNGDSRIQFTNLRFAGANLTREIATVAGFLKPAGSSSPQTEVSTMNGDIIVRDGVAGTTDVKAALDFGTIAVTGTADLARQLLDLRINAVVTQKVAQQVGGTSIGGFMRTALQNGQGELVIPVRVTGSFEHPKITPDLESFALMKLKTGLPDSSDPAAGISDIFEAVLGQQAGGQPPETKTPETPEPTAPGGPQQNPAQKTLQEILQALSAKKQNEKQQPESKPSE